MMSMVSRQMNQTKRIKVKKRVRAIKFDLLFWDSKTTKNYR